MLNNTFSCLLIFALFTIPLHYRYNSIAVILLTAFSLYQLKFKKFYYNKALLFPVLLYFIMLLSLLWTIDFELSFQALLKEITLILVPICFFLNPISTVQIAKIKSSYAYIFLGYSVFYLLKAALKFLITKDSSVFFYHELVTLDVNAIHVSVYCSLAFFIFLTKEYKNTIDKCALTILGLFIFLLSSKNIIVIFIVLLLFYLAFNFKKKIKKTQLVLYITIFSITLLLFSNKIKERFLVEIQSSTQVNSLNNNPLSNGLVYNVNVLDAWTKDKFTNNDFFAGTALRVYQIRIFKELLQEDKLYFTGYGLNASWEKIKQKRIEHNLYDGYEGFNFHNQYIQNFAELGFFAFAILVIMVILTLKNAITKKDFVHFSFAVLMISLFLTESFLCRQRGLFFYILFYCLFNSNFTKIKAIIKPKKI